jgi:hypothetical protein
MTFTIGGDIVEGTPYRNKLVSYAMMNIYSPQNDFGDNHAEPHHLLCEKNSFVVALLMVN